MAGPHQAAAGPTGEGRVSDAPNRGARLFTAAFGALLALALLKFGNPIILDRLIESPANIWEVLFQPWPIAWGYAALLGCLLLGLATLKIGRPEPWHVALLLSVWLGWQIVAAMTSIEPRLTRPVLMHFTACVVCFFAGLFGLARTDKPKLFWVPVLLAFAYALWMGFEQHYGGLEATRKMFYERPDWQQYPPEYIKKIESNRIFSTLVYPNALAGAILLLLPAMLLAAWNLAARLQPLSRAVLVGVLGYAAAACLVWSGSKSGWLIALVLLLAVLLRQPFSKRAKTLLVLAVVVAGLTGFFVRYAAYFGRGAPSVSARFEYWKAGLTTALENPVLGTGPGTFSVAYRKIKPPDAEMAQLTHNDYLQQASDSGLIGCLAYTAFVLGSLILLPRFCGMARRKELFAMWLGLLGWSLQSCVEFLLYIPALAWTAFALFGWLWGMSDEQGRTVGANGVCPSLQMGRAARSVARRG